MRKVIIEARVNEYAGRELNGNVPWLPAEIVVDAQRCVEAGAAIIHFHGRLADGGPCHEYETYRATVEGLRAVTNAMVHPTLGVETLLADWQGRLANVKRLSEEGLRPDFAPLDMVSSNADGFDFRTNRFLSENKVYVNTTETLRHFAQDLRAIGITPYAQIWNVPALRQLDCFIKAGFVYPPVFLSLGMTAGDAIATHPGTSAGLKAYLPFLPECEGLTWTATLFGGNLLDILPDVVEAGGHISIGIGDYPYAELGCPTNGDLIAEVVRRVRACGAEVATVDEARRMLGR